ncbi:MAG: PilZ domain-containing protein [Phycisphaerae bacterium]|jgi:c-di-GMP-binding flagellar brake protein YcgR
MSESLHEMVMREQRRDDRDGTEEASITTFVELPDGSKLEGVAKDISDGGMGVAGPTEGLHVGDVIDLILVVLEDQKVHYKAEVKHIDRTDDFFGLQFRSGPQPVEERITMWCKQCRREYAESANFCPRCGWRLRRM